jgi:hypothetical protein
MMIPKHYLALMPTSFEKIVKTIENEEENCPTLHNRNLEKLPLRWDSTWHPTPHPRA